MDALITILIVAVVLLVFALVLHYIISKNTRPPEPSARKWTDPTIRD